MAKSCGLGYDIFVRLRRTQICEVYGHSAAGAVPVDFTLWQTAQRGAARKIFYGVRQPFLNCLIRGPEMQKKKTFSTMEIVLLGVLVGSLILSLSRGARRSGSVPEWGLSWLLHPYSRLSMCQRS